MSRFSDNRSAPLEDGIQKSGAESTDDDTRWVRRFKNAFDSAAAFHDAKLRGAWSRNLRAFQNRHMSGSKYESSRYRTRSKLFKPKTRIAVRKNDAAAAQALFSTQDAVNISAERPSDKLQATTARWIYEALNFRLDRTNKWAGPNWFLTAIGARQETQTHGICVSKQFWEYETRKVIDFEDIEDQVPVFDEFGAPVIDMMTGAPVLRTETSTIEVEDEEVIKDRLQILLIPPEHAYIDPAGDWRDPIQEGGYFIAAFPCREDDVKALIEKQADRNVMGGAKWRDIDIAKVTQGRGAERQNQSAVRRARGDGVDRYETSQKGQDNDVIWLYECFYRVGGEDYTWWMLGESLLLSTPVKTETAYPAHSGERPYVRGLGELEAHKTHPMAPVESWQQMQMEINDLTNLELDARKMAISPITKIRKGRGVDLKQVQNRGPDAAILVEDEKDVTFDRAPAPDGGAQMAINIISNDLDDLAGVFSGSSVQSNRMLNETVGGMKLLAGSANALTEFDLRVFVETWVEPVLSQCVRLIRYYESDEVVISVAGERAGLIENITADNEETQEGLDPSGHAQEETVDQNGEKITLDMVLGNLDKAQVTVAVNVGLGAMDPQQKAEKFMGAVTITKDLAPLLEEQGVQPNGAALLQEAWGIFGYKDADRFFITKKEDPNPAPPPEIQLKQMELEAKDKIATEANQTKIALEQMRQSFETRMAALEGQMAMSERAMGAGIDIAAGQVKADPVMQQIQQMQQQIAAIAQALGAGRPQGQ